MNRSVVFRPVLLTAMLSVTLFFFQAEATQNAYQRSGVIAAIESATNTVVVRVRMGGRMVTVVGPLSDKAVLKKGGRSVELQDFNVGDRVMVKWTNTEKGPLIEGLEAR